MLFRIRHLFSRLSTDSKIAIPLLVALLVFTTSMIVVYCKSNPFIYLNAAIAIFCLLSIYWLRGKWRPIAWNLAIVFLCLMGFEAYLAGWILPSMAGPDTEKTPGNLNRQDPILGYALKNDLHIHKRKTYMNEEIFDVHYTIDSHGRRMHQDIPIENSPTVLFFGGSFTFGTGLEDHETLPWQFQESTGQRIQAINFGNPGYGAHQMLAILENHLEREVVSGKKPIAAVYTCISGHVKRAAGQAFWDPTGPHYVVNQDGSCTYADPFRNARQESIHRFLCKSSIYQRITTPQSNYSEDDYRRLVSIINRSQEILRERYQMDLSVILWSVTNDKQSKKLQKLLDEAGIDTIIADAALPDFASDPERYKLHPKDGHPNALANQILAATLFKHLNLNDSAN